MSQVWTMTDPPATVPDPVALRGIANLAGNDHSSFPSTVPYARDSLLWIQPEAGNDSPEAAAEAVNDLIATRLVDYPRILLRGFRVFTRNDFSRLVLGVTFSLHDYEGGLAVRDKGDDGVSIASSEPPAIAISPHNENAYMPAPPEVVLFQCQDAAVSGGEVPLNDVRNIPANLPVGLESKIRERGIRYWRRIPRANEPLHIGWEQAFGTTDRAAVEDYLTRQGLSFRWETDDVLRFWFVRPAFTQYEGEEIWFNQLSESNADWWLHHPVFMAAGVTRDTAPSDTTYGDGEPFGDTLPVRVRGALWHSTELVKLEPGDVLLLDNYLSQHGRMPYQGVRQHHVALFKRPHRH